MAGERIVLDRLDHLVITARDVDATCRFYEDALGMRRESFGEGRVALHFGRQKINLHPYPSPVEIVAKDPRPGAADPPAPRARWSRSTAAIPTAT
jgi:catechol 2,3-dioxygenase-like lactoylglutathione lyase family enzyme